MGKQAKPLPHIFGSAAYIQDPHAGLGALQPEQGVSAVTVDQPGLHSSSGTVTDAGAAGPSRPAHQAPATSSAPIVSEPDCQPQNFRAMLEAALKEDLAAPSGIVNQSEAAGLRQDQGSVHQDSEAERAGKDTESLGLHVSRQQSKDGAASADLPHVLAWLEKGRSLFDEDE